MTLLRCLHCDQPMIWLGGNPVFSFWNCQKCRKEYSFNIWTEIFEDEIDIKTPSIKGSF
jgi:hypothetical protein